MRILSVDIGTGTQDIYLFDSKLDPENGFKLVVPSPTMIIYRTIQEATRRGQGVALSGVTMGGGPSHWAARDHAGAGYDLYATPDAARTFNDDLDEVRESGIKVVSEDELIALPGDVLRLELKDFDYPAIASALGMFGVPLDDLDAAAVAVFDHGAAPPGVSDRQFRFDYLMERLKPDKGSRQGQPLSRLAFLREEVPPQMTRLRAAAQSTRDVDAPVVVMDTAPAAVLGASLDPRVREEERVLSANVGNFHTLAFRLGPSGVEGVFEHHTGLLDLPKLEDLIKKLALGSLQHEEVFEDHGHGALVFDPRPMSIGKGEYDVVVTGPRRDIMRQSGLRPYFAAPFGDMMLTGCFGLLDAAADVLPNLGEEIRASLRGEHRKGTPPWEVESRL